MKSLKKQEKKRKKKRKVVTALFTHSWHQVLLLINLRDIGSFCPFTDHGYPVVVFGANSFGFGFPLDCGVEHRTRSVMFDVADDDYVILRGVEGEIGGDDGDGDGQVRSFTGSSQVEVIVQDRIGRSKGRGKEEYETEEENT